MSNIIVGLIAVLVGALFCFRGVLAMRVVIAIWGAFVGFTLGAGVVAAITGDAYLSGPIGWIVGIVAGLAFALIAHLFYAVAVVLAMASVGFAVGTAVMAALGVTWSWVLIVVGVLVGVGLAIAAIALNLPAILLVAVSALGGATAAVGGIMLLTSTLSVEDFSRDTVTATIGHDWWWYAAFLAFVVAGAITQSRLLSRETELRQQW